MEDLNIRTDEGILRLTPATSDELKHIAAEWPMGVVVSRAETEPNGLVFQVGEEEAYGIKLQPPDVDERTAKALYFNNLALIASALPFYLQNQHRGIMVPCAYYKKKIDGRFESGFAFFVSPQLASKLAPATKARVPYDDVLGDGASNMIFDFVAAIPKAGERVNLPFNKVIGVDLRPRLALGALGMPFLVRGTKVFAIQYPLGDEHPIWTYAVRAGYAKLAYVPMTPAAVPGPLSAAHGWQERVRILSQRQRGADLDRQ